MLRNCSCGTLMSYTDHSAQLQVEHTYRQSNPDSNNNDKQINKRMNEQINKYKTTVL